MQGAFVHLELHTDDTAAAKAFYAELFGWNYTDVPMGDSTYTMIATSKEPGGGMQYKGMPDAPTMWLPYITVEDVHETVAKARSAGAEVIVEYMEAPGFGAGAIMRDPTGATFGVWRAFQMAAEPPAPVKAEKPAKAPKPAKPAKAEKPAKVEAPAKAEKPAAKTSAKKVAAKAEKTPAKPEKAPAKPVAKKAAAKPAAKKKGKR